MDNVFFCPPPPLVSPVSLLVSRRRTFSTNGDWLVLLRFWKSLARLLVV